MIKPIGDLVIVKQILDDEVSAGGIVLAIDKDKKLKGRVVAVGEGKKLKDGSVIPMSVSVGEVILFGEFCVQKFKIKEVEYLVLHEPDIIGVLDDE